MRVAAFEELGDPLAKRAIGRIYVGRRAQLQQRQLRGTGDCRFVPRRGFIVADCKMNDDFSTAALRILGNGSCALARSQGPWSRSGTRVAKFGGFRRNAAPVPFAPFMVFADNDRSLAFDLPVKARIFMRAAAQVDARTFDCRQVV